MGKGAAAGGGAGSSEPFLKELFQTNNESTYWGHKSYREWVSLADEIMRNANNPFTFAQVYDPGEMLDQYQNFILRVESMLSQTDPDYLNVKAEQIAEENKSFYAVDEGIFLDVINAAEIDIENAYSYEAARIDRQAQLQGYLNSSQRTVALTLLADANARKKADVISNLKHKELIRQQEIQRECKRQIIELLMQCRTQQLQLADTMKQFTATAITANTDYKDRVTKNTMYSSDFDQKKFSTLIQLMASVSGAVVHEGDVGPSPGQAALSGALAGAAAGGSTGSVPLAIIGAIGGGISGYNNT